MNWTVSVSQKQKVLVTNKHGEKLVGLLHENGSREIVILCHGARASKVGFCDCFVFLKRNFSRVIRNE